MDPDLLWVALFELGLGQMISKHTFGVNLYVILWNLYELISSVRRKYFQCLEYEYPGDMFIMPKISTRLFITFKNLNFVYL